MDVDMTDVEPMRLLRAAYELSGIKHKDPVAQMLSTLMPEVSEAELRACINSDGTIDADYVNGRPVKFHTRKTEDGRIMMATWWFDHSQCDMHTLMGQFGKLPAAGLVVPIAERCHNEFK
jgi:hypothetical protein